MGEWKCGADACWRGGGVFGLFNLLLAMGWWRNGKRRLEWRGTHGGQGVPPPPQLINEGSCKIIAIYVEKGSVGVCVCVSLPRFPALCLSPSLSLSAHQPTSNAPPPNDLAIKDENETNGQSNEKNKDRKLR